MTVASFETGCDYSAGNPVEIMALLIIVEELQAPGNKRLFGSRNCILAGITGDRAANCSKGGAARRTPRNMTLRLLLIRRCRLGLAWIKPALAYSP